jgi:hypothetical protein
MPSKGRNVKPRKADAQPGQRWEDRMIRWTVLWPKDLKEAVIREAKRTGSTHARVVADCVRRGWPR